ncbi:MAG: PKD domain-containing protein [Candidatus Natronoplasma sp.]
MKSGKKILIMAFALFFILGTSSITSRPLDTSKSSLDLSPPLEDECDIQYNPLTPIREQKKGVARKLIEDQFGNEIFVSLTTTIESDDEHPTAAFDYSPEDPTIGEPIRFTDRSSGGDAEIVEWNWSFGDGLNQLDETTSNKQNPNHTYEKEGIFTVELTVTDAKNRSDTIRQNIHVDNEGEIPNVVVFFVVIILGVVTAVAFSVLEKAFGGEEDKKDEESFDFN